MRLILQDVTKIVRRKATCMELDLVSRSFNMLVGPTQADKTSLLRLMAGLDRRIT